MAGLFRALEPAQGSKVAFGRLFVRLFLRRPCRTPAPPARTAHDTARAHLRVAALSIDPPRSLAHCKAYHQHGKCQPMGFQDGEAFFADEFVRHTVGTYTSKQLPQQEIALKAVRAALKHVLDTRSPHLAFMLVKEYWFRELYLGLKVAASFDRNESYQRTIDGQIRCITADFKPTGAKVAWNVNYVMYSSQPGWSLPCTTVPQPTPRKHQGGTVAECNGSESSSSHMV